MMLTVNLSRALDQFVESKMSSKHYKSMYEAIGSLGEKGLLGQADVELLYAMLQYKDEQHLQAAWEVYHITKDE